MNLLPKLLNEIVSKLECRETDIVVLKGFPLEIVNQYKSEDFIGGKSFIIEEKYIDFVDLEKNKKNIAAELLSGISNKKFSTYETFLSINKAINDLIKDTTSFYIVENNLLEFYPSTSSENLPDVEECIEKGDNISENNLLDNYYVNSKIIDKKNYIQYYTLEDQENIINIKFLKSQNWDFNTLKTIKEIELSKNSLIYKYNDDDFFLNKIDLLTNSSSKISLNIDSTIQGNFLAKQEVGFLIDYFEKINIEFELLRIEYDLSISSRIELNQLLEKYWTKPNQKPSFNVLEVYQNPDFNNEIKEISQAEVVENIIKQYEDGNSKNQSVSDIFLTAPTGAGKSLLFQMPAIYLAEKYNAVTIIVSPLIALMKDQVIQLKEEKNYEKVAYINSEISLNERDEILKNILKGNISILYLSPELLLSYDIKYFIGERIIGLLVVDEAHLVTTWGRDFRVDYWYLGYHIQKIRKYARDKNNKQLRFPLVALTATAPYNGKHDIVFETISSLQMNNAIKYISKVKRNEITFDINQSKIDNDHEREKILLSSKRIEEYVILGDKTIVYCPWTRLVNALQINSQAGKEFIVSKYYGSLHKDEKQQSYEFFKSGKSKSMIATKAFGMGIDISDITRVYHFAPSGSLSDYIQEIGRLARDKKLKGIASIDFCIKDLKFIKILFGLSSIKNWQLQAVLEKINKIYKNEKRRNLLISVEDFSHIFAQEDDNNIDQKVKSSLMLLEKDLEQRYSGIKVLIGRPKSLFTKVFASTNTTELNLLTKKYGKAINEITYLPLNQKNISLITVDLDVIWKQDFSSKSFPSIKKTFYDKELFENIIVTPKIRIKIELNDSLEISRQNLTEYFRNINNALGDLALDGFFTKQQFAKALNSKFKNSMLAKRIADFILTIYSTKPYTTENPIRVQDAINDHIFIQARRQGLEIKYRLIDRAISKVTSDTIRDITDFFSGKTNNIKYVSPDSPMKEKYIKTAQIVEIFNLGLFEVIGGENAMIYLRINDPIKINTISYSNNYKNQILENIKIRHDASIELMENFFMTNMENSERWNYVEDYFLGKH